MENAELSNTSRVEQIGLTKYAPTAPLLLWTSFSPGTPGGGAVILHSLISTSARGRVLWVSPSSHADGRVRFRTLEAGSLKNRQRSLLLDSTVFAHKLASETLAVARANHVRGIWILLHGAAVAVAAHLVQNKEIPVHVTVHDDPAFGVALRSRRYLVLTPWIERCFARAISGASSVDVVSEGMSRRYRLRYGRRSLVVHRAVPGPVLPSLRFDSMRTGLRVGVLGNTYRSKQLLLLAHAVQRASTELGLRGCVTVIGQGRDAAQLRRDLGKYSEVEETGHLDEVDAISILRSCFLLYLNYPFGRRAAVFRNTSFPTKLSTYVMAARPILVHAPVDSTLQPLMNWVGYVQPWTSMKLLDGSRLLVSAWRDERMHLSAHETAEEVRARFFEPETNRSALLGQLNELVAPMNAERSRGH